MASSSSSSSSAPGYTGEWEYDVFVCFRGKDTRDSLTSHLAGYLRNEGLRVFTDVMLERTEDIDELLSIIATSAMSVVIFSENFAESSWCLDEVATIAERKQNFGHRVLPVFYKVNPDSVLDDSGTQIGTYLPIVHTIWHKIRGQPTTYEYIIDTKHKPDIEKKTRWMCALKAVAGCVGRTTDEVNDDYELCTKIMDDISKQLTHMSSSGNINKLVGMEARISTVQQLLAMDSGTSNDTRVIGFWGMGGVGKTTLATTLYQRLTSPTNRIKHHFFVSVRASDVDEQVRELYSTLLSQKNLSLVDLDFKHRRDRLSRLKVVVVLDNVDTLRQLEKLLLGEIPDPTKLFGPKSVIIITSRNRGVLNHANARIHDVKELGRSDSFDLFRMHAFRQSCPSYDLEYLSRRAIVYCKGNPLAIKILGGTLFGKDKEYWESFVSGLEKSSQPGIDDVLSKSYYALRSEEQRLFMDVAFLSFHTSKTVLVSYLATCYDSAYCLVEDLISKSLLVNLPSNNKCLEFLVVPYLLQKMAWNIVKAESNPRWLKDPDYIRKLFAIGESKEFKALESLVLNLSKVNELCLGAKAFEGMNRLRFLSVFYYLSAEHQDSKISLLENRLDSLPNELRWLQWIRFPLESLPDMFLPEKMVVISLRHSQIKWCWKGVQPNLVHLNTLDLSYSLNLMAVPNLSGSKKLEYLYLMGCESLVELPSSVQYLDKLVELNLSDCPNLMSLPARLNSKFLEYVYLFNCPKLTVCPEINSSEVGLQVLDLCGTPVREVPSAIHKVKQGGYLRLCGEHLTSFPRISKGLELFRLCHTMITTMDVPDDSSSSSSSSSSELLSRRSDKLELVENSKLVSLSSSIWDMVKYELLIKDCPLIESLPDISNLVNDLREVYIEYCWKLKSFPSGISNLISVHTIRFCGTDIKSLPSSIHQLGKLAVLELEFCRSLESIPDNIHQLAKLNQLSLWGCIKIQYLPQAPPELKYLYVGGCKSLKALPSNTEKLKLCDLWVENCFEMDDKLASAMAGDFHSRAPASKGSMLYSGSSLPEWCSSSSSCLNCEMELLPPSANVGSLKGIPFGVLFSVDDTVARLCVKCDVVIECSTVATFSSPQCLIARDGIVGSPDYVLLWVNDNLLGETKEGIKEEDITEEPWYVKYAGCIVSFRLYAVPHQGNIKLERFGVSLLY